MGSLPLNVETSYSGVGSIFTSNANSMDICAKNRWVIGVLWGVPFGGIHIRPTPQALYVARLEILTISTSSDYQLFFSIKTAQYCAPVALHGATQPYS